MGEILLFLLAIVCIGGLGRAFMRITQGTPFANHGP